MTKNTSWLVWRVVSSRSIGLFYTIFTIHSSVNVNESPFYISRSPRWLYTKKIHIFKLCRKSNINKLIEIVCMTKPIQLKLGFEPKERLAKFRKRNPFLKRLALSTYEKELLGYHRWTGAITLKTRGDKYEMSNEQLIIKKGYFNAIDVNFMRSAVIVCVTRGWGWEVSFVSYYRYFWMHGAGFL